MKRHRWGWVAGLVLIAGSSARADLPATAGWIDREAIVYLELIHPETLLDGVDDPRFRKLLSTVPTIDRAVDSPKLKELRQVVEIVAAQIGTTPEKGLRDLLGGGLTMAVEGEKSPERILIVVTPRDPAVLDRAVTKVVELAEADALKNNKPAPFSISEHRGVSIRSAEANSAMAVIDGRLALTNGLATMKTLIDRVRGDSQGPGIAGHAGWSSRRSAIGPDSLGFAFARLDRLRAIDPAKYGGDGPGNPAFSFLLGPWYESSRKSDWVAAKFEWSGEKLVSEVSLPDPPGGRSKALARFAPPKGISAPSPLIPPRMIASVGLWRDLSAIWEIRAEIFPPETLEKLAQLDTFAGQFFGGRDFGTGVLGSISSDWRLVVARQDEKAIDPVPDLKLPSIALVINLAPGDEEFATRLMSAFQSFVGLVNLGAAQTKAPPLMLGSETIDGTVISTSRFIASKPKPGDAREPVDRRFNFSPSAARVGDTFFLSSTIGLARDLVKAASQPPVRAEGTLAMVADGDELARLVEQNRTFLVLQNMLKKGQDKATAEAELGTLASIFRILHKARLSAVDGENGLTLRLEVEPKP